MKQHHALLLAMIDYERACPQRIQHFLKVFAFCELIAGMEALDERRTQILLTAAIVHDIGIAPALKKYNSSAGPYQEMEGPAQAKPILASLGYDEELIDRVLFLIAHHHSYDKVDGPDYQILIEADFLVNIYEGNYPVERIGKIREEIFKTQGGKQIFDQLYPLTP